MYAYHPSSRAQLGQTPGGAPKQIRFIEADITRLNKDGRVTTSFRATGAMDQKKVETFINKFLTPILKDKVGQTLLAAINRDSHVVNIAWGRERFGFNGTVALNRDLAKNGQGSDAVIFIDEKAHDLDKLPTIIDHPDVGLYHELAHARIIQQGKLIEDEREMERRVIGIGKYTDAKGTENDYRESRGLPRRCCWEKETLEGIEGADFRPYTPQVFSHRSRTGRATNGGSFGEPFPTPEFSDGEMELVFSAVKGSVTDANQLSDRVFFARHPERQGKPIDPRQEPGLADEWKNIKGRLVLPILAGVDANEKGKAALLANQFAQAVTFFDKARRVPVSPAQARAGATYNLGIASYQMKRFAAAIGYFEVVRTFPGISNELKAKAEKMFAQAKQEYSKAVP